MKLLEASLFVLLLPSVLFPQGDSSSTSNGQAYSAIGPYALAFYLTGSAGLAYVHSLSDISDIRLSIDFDAFKYGYFLDGINFSSSNHDSVTATFNSNEDRSSGGITLSVLWLNKLDLSPTTHMFLGCGPLVAYSKTVSTGDSHTTNSYDPTGRYSAGYSNEISWTYGARAVLGLECEITHSFGILSEYSLSATRQKRDTDNSTGKATAKTNTLALSNARFALLFYL